MLLIYCRIILDLDDVCQAAGLALLGERGRGEGSGGQVVGECSTQGCAEEYHLESRHRIRKMEVLE